VPEERLGGAGRSSLGRIMHCSGPYEQPIPAQIANGKGIANAYSFLMDESHN